jgi:type II secretory pathway pseudopilin PulG
MQSFRTVRAGLARGAFSLLELIIVLMIMVGMLAVVWPNLSKPLEKSTLREAAQSLRDAIDETRYQAQLDGNIYFVHFVQGQNQIACGDVASFVGKSGSDSSSSSLGMLGSDTSGPAPPDAGGNRIGSGSTIGRSTESSTIRVRSWELPATVEVFDVQWATTPRLPSESKMQQLVSESGMDNTASGNVASPAGQSFDGNDESFSATSQSTLGNPGLQAGSSRQWWLPVSAAGRGRDASIILYDRQTKRFLSVVYLSATGALEIVR